MTQCGSPALAFSEAVVVPRGRGVGRSVAAGCLVAAGADDPLGPHSGELAAAAPATPTVATPRNPRRLSPRSAARLPRLRSALMGTRMPHVAAGRHKHRVPVTEITVPALRYLAGAQIWSKSPMPLVRPPPPDHCHLRAWGLVRDTPPKNVAQLDEPLKHQPTGA